MAYEYLDKADLTLVISTLKTKIDGYLANYVKAVEGKGLSTNDLTNDMVTEIGKIVDKADTSALNDYVKKVTGKDLSTNDLTDALVTEINKVANKADLASPALTGVPTAPTGTEGDTSTQIATDAFVATAIANALKDVTGIKFKKVDALPETGENGTIYLVAKTTPGTQDIYDEYYWTGDAFEYMGSTAVDLSGYIKDSDVSAIKTEDIDAMFQNW